MNAHTQFEGLANAAATQNIKDAETHGIYPMEGIGPSDWLQRKHVAARAKDALDQIFTWGPGFNELTFRQIIGGAANYSSKEQRIEATDLIARHIPDHIDVPVVSMTEQDRRDLLSPVMKLMNSMSREFFEKFEAAR